jgi:hypothetical protein
VQKVCTLWTHDDNFSRDEIIFHGERFPELPTSTGALLQIVAIHTDNTVRDFHTGAKSTSQYATQHRTENGSIIPGGREIDAKRAYVFVPRALPADLKTKHPNLQVRYT